MESPKSRAGFPRPRLSGLALFAFGSGLGFLVAWIATTGRVAYVFVMLLLAAALAYAVIDLMDYEIVKKNRQRQLEDWRRQG
jgi:4-hydroxybenzoate polyprenyltransferase